MRDTLFDAQEFIFETLNNDNYQFDDPDAMKNWFDYGFVKKDVLNGEELKVTGLGMCDGQNFWLKTTSLEIPCLVKREKRFFEMQGLEFEDNTKLANWLNSDDAKSWFDSKKILVSAVVERGTVSGSLLGAFADSKREEFFEEIKVPTTVYKARVIGKNVGGFLVDVEGVLCFLPGSLASANKIINFDELIGKSIPVMIEDYIREGDTFIVSNKKYIQFILPKKIEKLKFDILYEGEITGTSKYGIFIEWDEIFTGLLHTSEMTEDTKTKFYERDESFRPGNKIKFFIKEIGKNNRIILTEFDSKDKVSLEDYKSFAEGTVQEGTIVNIKPIGCFMEFIYNETPFIGLLHYKEFPENFDPMVNDKINLYISNIDVYNKKIFLKWNKPEKVKEENGQ